MRCGIFRGTRVQIILFNKPFNVLCQFTDPGGRSTLADYIPIPGVYAAGRLDYDSEGLLVLTDSGRVQQWIADPRGKMAKTYWVQVEGVPTEIALQQLGSGVRLRDGWTRPAVVAQAERERRVAWRAAQRRHRLRRRGETVHRGPLCRRLGRRKNAEGCDCNVCAFHVKCRSPPAPPTSTSTSTSNQ